MKTSTTRSTAANSSRRIRSGAIKTVIVLLFWLLVWFLISALVGKELILPSPLAVAKKLSELCLTAAFWQSVGFTLLRILSGCLAGIILGCLLAALTCFSGAADMLLSPLIRTVRATPVASFIILTLLWFPRTTVPAFISMLMVLPVVWAGMDSAIRETDAQLLEMGRAFRFGRVKLLRYIYVSSVFPSFSSVCGTAVGLAWKSGVAAEVLCQPGSAIGTRLYFSKLYLETGELFAWTAVVVALSLLIERLLKLLLSRRSYRKGADAG